MAEKVTFDPINKIISVNLGVRTLDVQYDVYSGWKRWVLSGVDNSKYASALRTVGGDPLVSGKTLGATFFLTNGWKIRPPEEDCELNVIGNLYEENGGAVFVKTIGSYNAMIIQTVSNLTDSQLVESELAKSLDYIGPDRFMCFRIIILKKIFYDRFSYIRNSSTTNSFLKCYFYS